MRFLIDGYNLMHARGLLGRRFGPDGFRQARKRFLNDLAEALGPIDAHATTVVFDASGPPADLPRSSTHKGLSILFAVEDDDADSRIEILIARHATPRTLSVVSSDNRIRQAASRRRARAVGAEDFLIELDARKDRRRRPAGTPIEPNLSAEERARLHGLSPEEAARWEDAFSDVLDDEPIREALRGEPTFLTDAEIAEIEREIDREF